MSSPRPTPSPPNAAPPLAAQAAESLEAIEVIGAADSASASTSHTHAHTHSSDAGINQTHSHAHRHHPNNAEDDSSNDNGKNTPHSAHPLVATSTATAHGGPWQAAEHAWHAHAAGHRAAGSLTARYLAYSHKRWLWLLALFVAIVGVALFAIRFGAYPISLPDLLQTLMGQGDAATHAAIWRIRLPRIVGALVCGWGLALAGLSIQTLLKNPLASPSTIGISQGAAFGAASAIVLLEAQLYLVTSFAFAGAISAAAVVLVLAGLKRLSAEAVVLSGVALSSLFTSGTILLQFLANDAQLAMVVFWTFGDVARAGWREIAVMSVGVTLASAFLYGKRWDMNALISGEETAKGLGVNVMRTRMAGVVAAALVAALGTAFFGVIAFVGLIAPHMARRLVGADHRLSIPFSCVLGALLLLASDTIGRVLIGNGSLPVGVVTSCLGAPMFLYMLIRSYR